MENKTAEEIFETLNPQDGKLPNWAKEFAEAYASPIIEKHEALIAELEKLMWQAQSIGNVWIPEKLYELLNTYKPTK